MYKQFKCTFHVVNVDINTYSTLFSSTAILDAVNGTVGLYNGKQEIYDSGKSQRGKGAYGGANIVHRPHPENKNAASLLATPTPPFFISIFVATVGFVFIFVSPFRLL
ncbi:hypothetical protein CIPAW_01G256000 [Carya illinoinensis]|uniref:Uncharacterized protein n=1 Tax=Carya illinoinensis TaxID=32201 RepID=A0A8T1RS94_CARIL|nr:hypothetical protein CIPAW_01G256000 [Carya illinoinensis]